MFSESEYLKEMSMRVAAMRVCVKRPESGITHIPDDIYYLIMGIYVKEAKAEALKQQLIRSKFRSIKIPRIPARLYERTQYMLLSRYGRPFVIHSDGRMSWNYGPDVVTYEPLHDRIATRSLANDSVVRYELLPCLYDL
jgi:hypothetical protein